MNDMDCSLGDDRTISYDGESAWIVVPQCPHPQEREAAPHGSPLDHIGAQLLDRPCDEYACHDGWWLDGDGDLVCHCERCGGTGRHTFDMDLGLGPMQVSVVPGVVLPIYDWCPDEKPADHICHAWQGGAQSEQWWHHRSFSHDDWTEMQITLPPAAKPGMWAVKLAVSP